MADSPDGRSTPGGNTSLDYGGGGRTIKILPEDAGVCEGVSIESAAGVIKSSGTGLAKVDPGITGGY